MFEHLGPVGRTAWAGLGGGMGALRFQNTPWYSQCSLSFSCLWIKMWVLRCPCHHSCSAVRDTDLLNCEPSNWGLSPSKLWAHSNALFYRLPCPGGCHSNWTVTKRPPDNPGATVCVSCTTVHRLYFNPTERLHSFQSTWLERWSTQRTLNSPSMQLPPPASAW